ncbi:MAG: DUF192 domain-containing protein [Rickettsiales bacterium]|jgi:uncharacterized membrane protein (UPF0127 family)|nr:DUF192 domain-containing protein [Rickettsiales bacterium]
MKKILFCTMLGLAACGPRTETKTIGEKTLVLEVADTKKTRETGLMRRSELAPSRGMLFVFDEPGDHAMWMHNTTISLDMIFLNSDSAVTAIARDRIPMSRDLVTPCTVSYETSGRPAAQFEDYVRKCEAEFRASGDLTKYVVEVKAGESAGIKKGDKLI